MDNFRDVLRVQGINSMGYGSVSKMVMKDRSLTVEAKAIYSYFCSYAGAGDTAFPSVKSIREDLGMGEDRFYYHFLHLKAYGYIEVTERIDPGTKKFKSNLYTLVSNPVQNPELINQLEEKKKSKKAKSLKKSEVETNIPSEENEPEKPYPENKGTEKIDKKPYPDFPCTEIPCPENKGTNINNISFKNNSYLYNNQSIYQSSMKVKKTDRQTEKEINELDYISSLCELEKAYPSEGNYPNGEPIPPKALESFKQQRSLIEHALQTMYFADSIKVNDARIPQVIVRQKLRQLNRDIIESAMLKILTTKSIVSNNIAYIISTVYNQIIEYGAASEIGKLANTAGDD